MHVNDLHVLDNQLARPHSGSDLKDAIFRLMKWSWKHQPFILDFWLPSRCKWDLRSFGILRNVKWQFLIDFDVHGSVHRKYILIYVQQDATLHSLFIYGNCSACFGC